MSGLEEETYSTMFMSLRHPARRKILRMLAEKPRNFSEMLEELGISSSHLTYHLESLGELVSKMEDGRYKLSTFGEAAVATMSRVEEAPKTTEPRHPPALTMKWKSFLAVLMIGLVVLAGVCYTQYQLLNQISAEYQQLKELVELTRVEDVSLQSKYELRFFEGWEANATKLIIEGPFDCVIYSQYDNSTLCLVLLIVAYQVTNGHVSIVTMTLPSELYLPLSVQEGNAYDPTSNETAAVIWSLNATKSGVSYVPLPSKGWYTVSLAGPIRKLLDDSGKVIGYEYMLGTFGDVDYSLSLRIIYEGNYIPFIVTHGYGYLPWTDYIPPS